MKDTIALMEKESHKVVEAVNSRMKGEENTYKQAVEQERQCNRLAIALSEAKTELANQQRIASHYK